MSRNTYSNSSNDSVDEMESIRRGLEDYLRREVGDIDSEDPDSEYLDLEDWDSGDRDSEDWDSGDSDSEEWDSENSDLEDWDLEDRRSNHAEQTSSHNPKKKGKKNRPRKNSRLNPPEKSVKKKKKKKKSKLKRIFTVIITLLAAFFGVLYLCVGCAYNKLNYQEIESRVEESMKDGDVINILLIGNDSRGNGEDGRSDAMILLSINSKSHKIYMTSLLRDMYVTIPGYKNNRLNAAYSYGGPELLMDTIEANFDIEINRYMLVNFEAFANLVDAVGGVDLELTNEEVIYVNGYLVEYNILLDRPQGTDDLDPSLSGMVHLNGAQALAYSRNRYLGTDFGRTDRQRKVLSQVIKKLPGTLVTHPVKFMDGLMPNLTTNLTKGECYSLSLKAIGFPFYEIEAGSIPLTGTYKDVTIRDMAVLEVDFDANNKYLRETIYEESDTE